MSSEKPQISNLKQEEIKSYEKGITRILNETYAWRNTKYEVHIKATEQHEVITKSSGDIEMQEVYTLNIKNPSDTILEPLTITVSKQGLDELVDVSRAYNDVKTSTRNGTIALAVAGLGVLGSMIVNILDPSFHHNSKLYENIYPLFEVIGGFGVVGAYFVITQMLSDARHKAGHVLGKYIHG